MSDTAAEPVPQSFRCRTILWIERIMSPAVVTKRKPGPRGPGLISPLPDSGEQSSRCRRSGHGADAGAHQADAVEVGLLTRAFLGAFTGLVALVEQFDLLEFFEGFGEQALGVF